MEYIIYSYGSLKNVADDILFLTTDDKNIFCENSAALMF